MLSNEFVDSLLGEATRTAIEKIAAQLNSFAEKITVLRIEMDGIVAEVAGNSLTLNLGKKSGIKVGDKLSIFREVRAGPDTQTAGPSPRFRSRLWSKLARPRERRCLTPTPRRSFPAPAKSKPEIASRAYPIHDSRRTNCRPFAPLRFSSGSLKCGTS
jgi:hypothetical protein